MISFEELISGYKQFKTNEWQNNYQTWKSLSEGQSPNIMVIACSDSRVEPAQIFNTGPGQIFVVRNVAALVPSYETSTGYQSVAAALEFAVTQLKVSDILVMGHAKCGGCKASLTNVFEDAKVGEGYFIAQWVNMLSNARSHVKSKYGDDEGEAAQLDMELEAVKTSLTNLLSFPFVKDRVDTKSLTLHGAHFGIEYGALKLLNPVTQEFHNVE